VVSIILVISLCSSELLAPPVVEVTFDAAKAQRTDLTSEYVSVNIDTASIAHGFDFSDPVLGNLVQQLAPVMLRIGGSAANGLQWSGQPGMPCGCCNSHNNVVLSTDCFDTIYNFLNKTGSRLLMDFAATRGTNGAWNPADANGLMSYVAKKGYGGVIGAWQIGNENPDITNGNQMGIDFLALQALAKSYGLPDAIIGPSSIGTPMDWFLGFWKATFGKLSMFSVHIYAGTDCRDLTGEVFISRKTYTGFLNHVRNLYKQRNQYMAQSTGVLIEETASQSLGGCINMSDRFIDGFYWMTVIGFPGENGLTQINRQDVAGWSFLGLQSHYTLAGPPGWVKGSAELTPHPDWYSTILWKQLMGNSVLNFTWTGTADVESNLTMHAWCTPTKVSKPGSVTISYVVGWSNAVTLNVPTLSSLMPRTEYILTSSAAEYHSPQYSMDALPPTLFNDAIFLNGVRMTVDATGRLPQYPIQGKTVNTADAPLLPAYSYGFIVFPEAGVAACK